MTGPNPDAELDEALGVTELPPAAVTDAHRALARALLRPNRVYANPGGTEDIAQAIADAEQRGAARVIADRQGAGICGLCFPGDPCKTHSGR